MKRIMIIAAVLAVFQAIAAINVYVENGSEYKGEIQSNDGTTIILADKEVIISIPLQVIKSVLDEGRDVTKSVTGKTIENGGVDEHFIGVNDYFISDQVLGHRESMTVRPARLVVQSTAKAVGNQSFNLYTDGKNIKADIYFKTQIAVPGKLKTGTVVIYFDRPDEGIWTAPLNAEETRSGTWKMSKVTDTSFIDSGYVTVAGEIDVALDNLRTLAK